MAKRGFINRPPPSFKRFHSKVKGERETKPVYFFDSFIQSTDIGELDVISFDFLTLLL